MTTQKRSKYIKNFTCCFSLITILLLVFSQVENARASHAMGLDISYTCVGPDTYEFTMNFYRDCDGMAAPSSATLNVTSPSGCGADATISLTQQGPGVEVSPLCQSELANSTCASSTGTLPGVEKYTYTGTYTFPANCDDWVISYSHCCRNDQITTLVSPASNDLFVKSTLDNTNGLCNNGLSFTSLPVPFICAGEPFNYNHGALDADGDSLVYTMVPPLDGPAPGTPIAFKSGYTV
ncbi:MAG: hypothetical protein JKY33_00030, partial [Bacteroidia bacterium]|nr:hypothetical protein [Bacteroidia bacterium]